MEQLQDKGGAPVRFTSFSGLYSIRLYIRRIKGEGRDEEDVILVSMQS